jgi:membrane protein DedA with SNARE-associated domain
VHGVETWLGSLPHMVLFLVLGLVVAVESTGIPVPGEIMLVSSALLAAAGVVDPWAVAAAATIGAVVGDSIGYAFGRRGGRSMLRRLSRRFPRHLGPPHLARAEYVFARWGVWAVFFGRFIALLRILAGPLAGALHMPYPRFLAANALGGAFWAGGTTWAIYALGQVAEHWLKGFSWVALAVAVLFGMGLTMLLRHRAARLHLPGPAADSELATSAADR